MARGGRGGALLLRLVGGLAAPHAQRLALVQRVRQGGQESVRAGRTQRDGAACPDRNLLRQGRRRGGELKDGRERSRRWREGERKGCEIGEGVRRK